MNVYVSLFEWLSTTTSGTMILEQCNQFIVNYNLQVIEAIRLERLGIELM